MRSPSYVTTSRRRTESTILPYAWAVEPQELLPIMPPIAQLTWVEGFGPTIQPEDSSLSLSTSSLMPGSTTAIPASVSTEPIRVQYLLQSMTTAALQHCPARLVPPPRDN